MFGRIPKSLFTAPVPIIIARINKALTVEIKIAQLTCNTESMESKATAEMFFSIISTVKAAKVINMEFIRNNKGYFVETICLSSS